jgi:hypothetical protein
MIAKYLPNDYLDELALVSRRLKKAIKHTFGDICLNNRFQRITTSIFKTNKAELKRKLKINVFPIYCTHEKQIYPDFIFAS